MRFLRGNNLALAPLTVLLATSSAANAVTFDENIDMVYDNAPRLSITGSGFDTLDASNVKLSFAPPIKDDDYDIEISSSTFMTLSLKEGKKWMEFEDWTPSLRLYLCAAKTGSNSLLEEALQVATVVPAPTVQSFDTLIYMKTTPRVIVNGTNFNVTETQLYFDPPLNEGTVVQEILSSTEIFIFKKYRLGDPHVWGPEPGPLKLVGIDTGGGILQLNPQDGGVIVAEIQADLDGHGVTVNSHDEVGIYQSTKKLQITGEGFKDGAKVRFAKTVLRGGGTNFTITDTQHDSITLELKDDSKWHRNVDSLPGPLVLLAADVGDGWVPQGPTWVKYGHNVATVFEDPSVESSDIKIFRTHTHELMIKGTGFNTIPRPIIDFNPPLDSSEVYLQVVNRTNIKLLLSSTTAQWTNEDQVGPLTIKGIDTGAGMVTFNEPVQVAKVVADPHIEGIGHQGYLTSMTPSIKRLL